MQICLQRLCRLQRSTSLLLSLGLLACGTETATPSVFMMGVPNITLDYQDSPGDSDEGAAQSSQRGVCVVLIDEDGIDNDMQTVEQAADFHGIEPDRLVNDDRPTEVGNPPLLWSERYAGDIVRVPTGQVDDEGWFALPEVLPWSLADFVAGTVPQDKLDKIPDVMPLRNHELVQLVGRTCVAVVYDSDISMNYLPINANLQGARYGLLSFTVLGVELAGSLPESKSDTSLYDLWLRIEKPAGGEESFKVVVRDHEPDAIEIDRAVYDPQAKELSLAASSDFGPAAKMTLSVDGADAGADLIVGPTVFEVTVPNAGTTYEIKLPVAEDIGGRRVTISTDEGGAYNAYVD